MSSSQRVVPLSVALQLFFGRPAAVIGWFIFGFGMIFFWAFGTNTDPAAGLVFRDEVQTASGVVDRIEDTGFSVGGYDDDEGFPVLAYYYRFLHEGRQVWGVSYLTQEGTVAESGTEPAEVVVEFPVGRPERSRILGMRTAPLESYVILTALCPLVSLLVVAATLLRGWNDYRLLRNGKLTHARLLSREPTDKLTFVFESPTQGEIRIVVRTHQIASLQVGDTQQLLYDPRRPRRGTTAGQLPGTPRIRGDGGIEGRASGTAFFALTLAVLNILGHTVYALVRYVL